MKVLPLFMVVAVPFLTMGMFVSNPLILKERYGLSVNIVEDKGKIPSSDATRIEVEVVNLEKIPIGTEFKVQINATVFNKVGGNYVAEFVTTVRQNIERFNRGERFNGFRLRIADSMLDSTYLIFSTADGEKGTIEFGKLVKQIERIKSLNAEKADS